MITTGFNEGWLSQRNDDTNAVPVRLPHDALIGEPCSAEASTGNHGGYFPGGIYRYSKEWQVPKNAAEKAVSSAF